MCIVLGRGSIPNGTGWQRLALNPVCLAFEALQISYASGWRECNYGKLPVADSVDDVA